MLLLMQAACKDGDGAPLAACLLRLVYACPGLHASAEAQALSEGVLRFLAAPERDGGPLGQGASASILLAATEPSQGGAALPRCDLCCVPPCPNSEGPSWRAFKQEQPGIQPCRMLLRRRSALPQMLWRGVISACTAPQPRSFPWRRRALAPMPRLRQPACPLAQLAAAFGSP